MPGDTGLAARDWIRLGLAPGPPASCLRLSAEGVLTRYVRSAEGGHCPAPRTHSPRMKWMERETFGVFCLPRFQTHAPLCSGTWPDVWASNLLHSLFTEHNAALHGLMVGLEKSDVQKPWPSTLQVQTSSSQAAPEVRPAGGGRRRCLGWLLTRGKLTAAQAVTQGMV